MNNIKSEELLSRFRSKVDLYKYLTLQSKIFMILSYSLIVGLFLPSYEFTKLAFIRAILQGKKKDFNSTEVQKINVPRYEELSVKNLYKDVMTDPQVSEYLPDLEQASNKLPEQSSSSLS